MPIAKPDMITKSARTYQTEQLNTTSSFGVGASPVKRGRPPELEHPGCVGCIGCGSSHAKEIS